jgi:hypothetical protein
VSGASCRVWGLVSGLAPGSPPPRPPAKCSRACSRSGQGRSPSRGIACLFQPCLERAGHDDLAEATRGRIGAHALDQAIDAGAIVLAAHKQVGQPMGSNATQIGAHQALGDDGRVLLQHTVVLQETPP